MLHAAHASAPRFRCVLRLTEGMLLPQPPSVIWIDQAEGVFKSGKVKGGGGEPPNRILKHLTVLLKGKGKTSGLVSGCRASDVALALLGPPRLLSRKDGRHQSPPLTGNMAD